MSQSFQMLAAGAAMILIGSVQFALKVPYLTGGKVTTGFADQIVDPNACQTA